jgi:hypothetical protein
MLSGLSVLSGQLFQRQGRRHGVLLSGRLLLSGWCVLRDRSRRQEGDVLPGWRVLP